jgi:hypothetical protein
MQIESKVLEEAFKQDRVSEGPIVVKFINVLTYSLNTSTGQNCAKHRRQNDRKDPALLSLSL